MTNNTGNRIGAMHEPSPCRSVLSALPVIHISIQMELSLLIVAGVRFCPIGRGDGIPDKL